MLLTHSLLLCRQQPERWLHRARGAQKVAERRLGSAAGKGVRVVGARVPPNATGQGLDHSHGAPVAGREGSPGPAGGVGPYHLKVALCKQVSRGPVHRYPMSPAHTSPMWGRGC